MVSRIGGAATGGLSGAATGASIGSVIPGIGTAIGAGVGGLAGAIGGFLSGKGEKNTQLSTLNPQQQAYQNSLLQMLQGMGQGNGPYAQSQKYLSDILSGSPDAFNRFAAPHITQFEQQTLPRLAERFAGLGGGLGGGIGNSSGFGQAIGGAGAQFQSNLAGMYEQLRQQAAQQAMGQYNQLASLGLGRQSVENIFRPETYGFGPSAFAGLSQGIGQGAGQRLGYNMMNNSGNWWG